MLRITCSLLIGMLLLCNALSAQSFSQAAGVNISVLHTSGTTETSNQSLTFVFSNVSYFPRFNFIETEHSSVSIGAPVAIGFGRSANISADGSTSGLYWGFDAPLVLDYNIGAKSTRDNEDRFGGYFGGGFGYTYSSWNYFDDYTDASFKTSSYGPVIRAGMRFGFPNADLGMTIGLTYKIGLESQKFKTYGLSVMLDF